jgi:hypothetical protein
MYFTDPKTGEYNFNAEQLGEAHKWCFETARDYLKEGFSVAVANVNYQLKHFKLYIDLAEREDIPVFVLLVEGNFRDQTDDSVNKAPHDVVARQKRLWEPYAW